MSEITITEDKLGELTGKVAVVTGGASGIGKAIVELLSSRGAIVAFGDRDEGPGKALEAAAQNTHFHRVDVTDWAGQVAFFANVKAQLGRIDFVFANAGVGEKNTVFDDLMVPGEDGTSTLAAPDLTVLDVNLTGVIYTTKLALHHFRANSPPGGGLVMTASTSSYNERPNLPLYSVAKHGVAGLMRAVRHRVVDDNIHVGLIAPGGTVSSLFTPQAADAFRAQGAPVNEPETVARAAVYLANHAATNGQGITVIGNRCTEVETSLLETQPQWYGTYNTDMARRVASVRLDRLAKSD